MTVSLDGKTKLDIIMGSHVYYSKEHQEDFFIDWDDLSDIQRANLIAVEGHVANLLNKARQQNLWRYSGSGNLPSS